jgi:hypothetical protein
MSNSLLAPTVAPAIQAELTPANWNGPMMWTLPAGNPATVSVITPFAQDEDVTV